MLEDSLLALLPCPGPMCWPVGSLYVALVLDSLFLGVVVKAAFLSALQMASLRSESPRFAYHGITVAVALPLAIVQSVALGCLCAALHKRRPRLLLPFAFWKLLQALALVAFGASLFFEERLKVFAHLNYALGSSEGQDPFYMLGRRHENFELADYRNYCLLPLTSLGVVLALWAFVVAIRGQTPLRIKGGRERYREAEEEEIVYRHYDDASAPLKAHSRPPPPYNPHFNHY